MVTTQHRLPPKAAVRILHGKDSHNFLITKAKGNMRGRGGGAGTCFAGGYGVPEAVLIFLTDEPCRTAVPGVGCADPRGGCVKEVLKLLNVSRKIRGLE